MRYILVLATSMLGCALLGSALAQEDCLASLNVNPSKLVTFLTFGPNAGDKVSQTMSCPVAEQMRADMFVSGQAVDLNLLGNANELRKKVDDLKAKLTEHKAALQNASTRATREAALKSLKITVVAAGTVSAATGCVTSGTTCIPAVGGAVALYELVESTASAVGDLAQQAMRARGEIDKILPLLNALDVQLNDNLAQQGKLRYKLAFTELCKAIKQQCL